MGESPIRPPKCSNWAPLRLSLYFVLSKLFLWFSVGCFFAFSKYFLVVWGVGSDYGYACPDKWVSLSIRRCESRGVVVRSYGYYANVLGSTLTLPAFVVFFHYFFRLRCYV